MKTLVVGVGSDVMGDDGIGQVVVEELRKRGCPCDLAILGTDIFRLRLHYRGHERIIIVDALRGIPPGDVKVYGRDEFSKLNGSIRHAHLLGIVEAMDIMSLADPNIKEAEVMLVGVGAERIDKGIGLSPRAREGVKRAVDVIFEIVEG